MSDDESDPMSPGAIRARRAYQQEMWAIEDLARTRGFVLAVEVPEHPWDAPELRLGPWHGRAIQVRDDGDVFVVFATHGNDLRLVEVDIDKLRTAIVEYRQRHARARAEVAEIMAEQEPGDARIFMGVDYGSKVDEACVVVVQALPDGRRSVLSYGGPGSRLLAWVRSQRNSIEQEATVELSAEEWAKIMNEQETA